MSMFNLAARFNTAYSRQTDIENYHIWQVFLSQFYCRFAIFCLGNYLQATFLLQPGLQPQPKQFVVFNQENSQRISWFHFCGIAGSRNPNKAPCGNLFSAQIIPPWASIIWRDKYNPNPDPLACRSPFP